MLVSLIFCTIGYVRMNPNEKKVYTFGIVDGYKEYDLEKETIEKDSLYLKNNRIWFVSERESDDLVLTTITDDKSEVVINLAAAKFCYFVHLLNSVRGKNALERVKNEHDNSSDFITHLFEEVLPLLNEKNDSTTFLNIVKKIIVFDYAENILIEDEKFIENFTLESIFDVKTFFTIFSSFNSIFEGFMDFNAEEQQQLLNLFD